MSTNIVHPNINPEELTFEKLFPYAQECIAKVESAILQRSAVNAVRRGINSSTTELVDALVEASAHGHYRKRALVLQTPKQGLARKACSGFFAGIPESVCDDYGNLPPSCLFPLGIVAVRGTHLDEIQVGCPESGWFTQDTIHEAMNAKLIKIGFCKAKRGDPSPFLDKPTATIVTPRAQILLATIRENPTE